MRLGDPILTARILHKGPNRRWGSTSVTGRLSWLEHNGHRVASPRPQHASKRHSGTYVGGSQLGSICHSAKPTTWPHRLMATAVVAVAQLPINGGLPTAGRNTSRWPILDTCGFLNSFFASSKGTARTAPGRPGRAQQKTDFLGCVLRACTSFILKRSCAKCH